MKRALAWAVLALLLLTFPGQADPIVFNPHIPDLSKLIKGYCPQVIDGDTIWIEVVEDGIPVTHSYRLIGVDTPETVHPNIPPQPYGVEASAFTRENLLDQWVYIEYDIEKTDAYDRHLAYIWLEDGSLFNLTLLEKGYGKFLVIAPNVKYSAFLIYAQKAAKNSQVGVWSPLPAAVKEIDLASLTLTELMLLQTRITEELTQRSE